MDLPFSTEEFLRVFETYNRAIWPAQVVAYLLGAGCIWLAFSRHAAAGRAIAGVLAGMWLWMGLVYHLGHFTEINNAAYLFGGLFVAQGLLLALAAGRGALSFQPEPGAGLVAGAVFIAYALVVYPVLGKLLGHAWPRTPLFGVTPCPTTIFTFGILLWTSRKVPIWVLAIPALWSLIGFTAALKLTMYEDTALLVAGAVGTAWIIVRDARRASNAE